MEGGRQSEIAKTILGAKNVPYVVAAPLLIQVCLCGEQNVRALACMLCLPLGTGERCTSVLLDAHLPLRLGLCLIPMCGLQ
jgi:hypothetical protein